MTHFIELSLKITFIGHLNKQVSHTFIIESQTMTK